MNPVLNMSHVQVLRQTLAVRRGAAVADCHLLYVALPNVSIHGVTLIARGASESPAFHYLREKERLRMMKNMLNDGRRRVDCN